MVRCMAVVQMQTGSVIGGGSTLSRSAPVSSLRTSTHVWSADVQGNIIIWDPLRMAAAREVAVARGEAIFSLCQVGRSVWIGTSGQIFSVDLQTFAMFNWRGHERPINDLIYHDGLVWTASNDGTIKVWEGGSTPQDVHLVKEFNVLPGSILFALANGKHLICGGHTDGAILAWNPQNAGEVARFGEQESGVRSLLWVEGNTAHHLDDTGEPSRRLALWAGSRDGTIHVWQLEGSE
ncbi:WD domain, G-beta repeat-containing protein [Acanthamoeba castellanii str. Neff]|uniref:WD domain, G-beta repeat-containing protein n=1 Tax=Acanthamoeba castellanii (strain ATCC 30010 / Neff) TaxID=1257118 RepID=L8GJT4_ACACF|nr:WD domain, G-beta repeat-containing protein [Acanthamoeba castellanii str. Neff]ELR13287.1 WD domain, G-beta repeat-containing protein [Acanthamoeba castellanii str. Neff]